MAEEGLAKYVERLGRELSKIRNESLIPATEDTAGLMSPQARRDLTHALGIREWISDSNVDVLGLVPGNYATIWSQLVNTPIKANETMQDAPYVEIDVDGEYDSSGKPVRTQLTFYESSSGRRWYMNIHNKTGVGTPNIWRLNAGESELWVGSVQNVNTQITLADSLDNYSKVQVGYGVLGSTKHVPYTIGETIDLRDTNLPNNATDLWHAEYETTLQVVNSTTLRIQNVKGILISPAGASTVDTNKIVISSIVGVR